MTVEDEVCCVYYVFWFLWKLEHGLDVVEETSVCAGSFPLSVSRRRDHVFTGRVNIYPNDRVNKHG